MKRASLASAGGAGCIIVLVAGVAACTAGGAPPAAPGTVTIAVARAPESPSSEAPPSFAPPEAEAISETPDAVRDDRRLPRGKPRALLLTQLQGLESLFASTAPASPDRPALLRRLAETAAELVAAAQRDRSPSGGKALASARGVAIKHYGALARQYPKWCASPYPADPDRSTGCADDALYYLGLEAERAGQLDTSRKAYLELIQSFPQSRHIAPAYLAFGEMFLAEAANDPSKLALAEQSYAEATKYPPPGNRVYAYAHYRLGEVYARKGDDARALADLMKAAQLAIAQKDASGLGAAARRQMVASYAKVGDPAKARDFFSRIASGAELEQMLGDLEQRRPAP